ncbi:MAG TPA: carboxypeptidase-like regulatory domain-containing protein, partial [Bryobacteraceae bacterium]|nr:carboxypeptidase-like regulatory domain-containing protein [Bryobacteraceae bacterium]
MLRKCLLPVLIVMALLSLQAQDITKGSIAGVVRDSSGAVLANAKVRLDSPYGERTALTSGTGEYTFSNVVVGSGYTLIVEQPGFATAKISNLNVGVNQRTTADVTLQLGSTTQTVDVTSEA